MIRVRWPATTKLPVGYSFMESRPDDVLTPGLFDDYVRRLIVHALNVAIHVCGTETEGCGFKIGITSADAPGRDPMSWSWPQVARRSSTYKKSHPNVVVVAIEHIERAPYPFSAFKFGAREWAAHIECCIGREVERRAVAEYKFRSLSADVGGGGRMPESPDTSTFIYVAVDSPLGAERHRLFLTINVTAHANKIEHLERLADVLADFAQQRRAMGVLTRHGARTAAMLDDAVAATVVRVRYTFADALKTYLKPRTPGKSIVRLNNALTRIDQILTDFDPSMERCNREWVHQRLKAETAEERRRLHSSEILAPVLRSLVL